MREGNRAERDEERSKRRALAIEKEIDDLLEVSRMRVATVAKVGGKLHFFNEEKLFQPLGFESLQEWFEDRFPTYRISFVEQSIQGFLGCVAAIEHTE